MTRKSGALDVLGGERAPRSECGRKRRHTHQKILLVVIRYISPIIRERNTLESRSQIVSSLDVAATRLFQTSNTLASLPSIDSILSEMTKLTGQVAGVKSPNANTYKEYLPAFQFVSKSEWSDEVLDDHGA